MDFHRSAYICYKGYYYPFGFQRFSMDLHRFTRGVPLRVSTDFRRLAYISQWVRYPLGFHRCSIDLYVFCEGRTPEDVNGVPLICIHFRYPLGVQLISLDLLCFTRGALSGFQWISIDLHTFCEGYSLGSQGLSMDLHPFYKGRTPQERISTF